MRHGHTNWIILLREGSFGRMVWWSFPSLYKGATKCFVASGPLYVTNIQGMATTDGAQQMWPPWTSESDISQETLKWYHTCPRGPLDTMGPSDDRPDENFQKWSSRATCNLRRTINGMRCVAHFTRTGWAMQLGCETCSATHARTKDPLRVRRTLHRRSAHVRRGLHSQDVASRTTRPTCNGMASDGLTDRCRPTTTRMVPYMLEKAAEHGGTIRWPFQ